MALGTTGLGAKAPTAKAPAGKSAGAKAQGSWGARIRERILHGHGHGSVDITPPPVAEMPSLDHPAAVAPPEAASPDPFLEIAAFLLRLRRMGVTDRRLSAALEAAPRTVFIPADYPPFSDRGLPIDCGQVSTPPIVVARILAALAPQPTDRVLEIGTGTGYMTAVLARLCHRVYTVDRFRTLVLAAQSRLAGLGIENVTAVFGDGFGGWPDKAPFDRIVSSGSAEGVPAVLAEQLRPGGVLVMPVGPAEGPQMLMRVERTAEGSLDATPIAPVRAIPLIPGKAARL
ncbi:protein-L-isoaspartate(D-aspartate) O-methyltransferase [Prosthecomicrobium pneumaticum]|nr:protein-L-isoaspartate(D-aspartate) O-methyltransferase [Prosthecomicrobium pneumaticum]